MIKEICEKYWIENYTINLDGSIDVYGSVDLSHYEITELSLKFNIVTGDFTCSDNKLTTLEGCPKFVGGYFSCMYNNLTSLEGGPKSVGRYYSCSCNYLTTLKGCPKSVGGIFYCYENDLTTNISDIEEFEQFHTSLKERGLNVSSNYFAKNYKEWNLNKKRKNILKKIIKHI